MTTKEVDKLIMDRVKHHKKLAKLQCKLKEDDIIGIFAYGSMNYDCFSPEGYHENTVVAGRSNIDTVVVAFPQVRKEVKVHKHKWDHCRVRSLDNWIRMLIKQDINSLESLVTKYCIINPKYKDVFNEYFKTRANEIAHINPGENMIKAVDKFAVALQTARKDYVAAYHAFRLHSYAEEYYKGFDFADCINTKHPNKSMRIKKLRNGRRISRSEEKYFIKEARRLKNKAIKSFSFDNDEELVKSLHEGGDVLREIYEGNDCTVKGENK